MWQDSLWPLWSRFLPSLIYDTFRALHKTECFPSHSFISSKHNHLALNHCSAQSCKYIFPHFGYTHLYRKAANAKLPHPIVWHWLPLTPSTITLQTFKLTLNQTKSKLQSWDHSLYPYGSLTLVLLGTLWYIRTSFCFTKMWKTNFNKIWKTTFNAMNMQYACKLQRYDDLTLWPWWGN